MFRLRSISNYCCKKFSKQLINRYNFSIVNSDGTDTVKALRNLESLNCQANLCSVQSSSASVLDELKPGLPRQSYSIAPFVNVSDCLASLVNLGVDLSHIELKFKDVAQFLITANFEQDIKPRLLLLHQFGISDGDLAHILTKSPSIFVTPVEDMETRVSYLKSKEFSCDAILRIICKAPDILTQSTMATDFHLGYLQREFGLTGDEVRQAITSYPRLISCDVRNIKQNKFVLAEFFSVNDKELKTILLKQPKIYLQNHNKLTAVFDYLHNTMGIPYEQIVNFPDILRTRLYIIRSRHLFLKSLGKDQYNPSKENYVSLSALVCGVDAVFCSAVAKVSVQQFSLFQKTI